MNMLGSSDSLKQARFFGLDLSSLIRDLLAAWRGMLDWRVLSWLWPTLAVRLWLPSGGNMLSYGLNSAPIQDNRLAQAARFEAVLLPENLLLRRTLSLPKLKQQELMAALAIEAQTLNPFGPNDVVWTYDVAPSDGNTLCVHIVLASRKLVVQHIATTHPQLTVQTPEVWIPHFTEPGFVMMRGFGEARRQRKSTVWRWTSALLALLVLALLVSMAITPSIQLYLRARQANQSMATLQQQATPAIQQRESLVRVSEQLASLADLTGKALPPLQILNLITDALPDDTSLLSLQIQGLNVNISGQTGNASALMTKLGATPGMRDVKAPTPATKPLGAPRESFTIEFTLDPAHIKPAP